jgi:hypothetical protein
MKLKYFILPAVLLFVGAGCQNTGSQPSAAPASRVSLQSTVYFQVPAGYHYGLWNGGLSVVDDINKFGVMPGFEGERQSLLDAIVINNPKKLTPQQYIKQNYQAPDFSDKNVTNIIVANRSGVEFDFSEGFAAGHYIVIPVKHLGDDYLVRFNFDSSSAEAKKIVESIEFNTF